MKFLTKALPHIIAIVAFYIIASIYFTPAYNDYDLNQGDIDRFLGMSKELRDYRDQFDDQSLWTNSMFSGMPAYQISMLQPNNLPQSIITGIKIVFPGPVGILWLAMVCFYILCCCLRINPWLGMLGAVAFALASFNFLYLGAGHASKVAAVAITPAVLGGVIQIFRGNWIMGAAITSFFGAMELAANHPQITYYLAILLVFVVIFESIALVRKGEPKKLINGAAALLIAAVLSIIPNITGLLTTYNYSKFSTRGDSELSISAPGLANESPKEGLNKDYILEYSMSRGEVWSVLVPDIKGGVSSAIGGDQELLKSVPNNFKQQVAQSSRYWGEQRFTGGAFYYGAIIFLLFVVGLFFTKDHLKWPLLIASLLAAILAWKDASFITDLFLNYLPFFAKFRDTKMMLVLFQIAGPLLAVMTLNQLFNGDELKDAQKKMLFAGGGLVFLILILFLAIPDTLFDFISPAEKDQFSSYLNGGDPEQSAFVKQFITELKDVRMSIMRADVLRSLLFVVIGFGLTIALALKKLKPSMAIGLIALFTVVDLWSVDKRYLNNEKAKGGYVHWKKNEDRFFPFQASVADQSIFEQEVTARGIEDEIQTAVKNAEDRNGKRFTKRDLAKEEAAKFGELNFNSNYRVLNIGNPFNDARTSFFHKSIGGYHGAKLKSYQELIDFHLSPEINRFIEVANAGGLDAAFAQTPVLNMLNTKYLIADPNSPPIPNNRALGNVWFVDEVEMQMSSDDEIEALGELDPAFTALVHERYQDEVTAFGTGSESDEIFMTSYLPNQIEYRSKTSDSRLAVFSEIFYPEGWEVSIDGEPASYFRANYLLRAMMVPAGEHTIIFTFNPAAYNSGRTLALVGSILLVLLLGFAIYKSLKSPRLEDLQAS